MGAEIQRTENYSLGFLDHFNSARAEAEITKNFLEERGGRGVILGNGGNKANLEKIFQASLLGLRLKNKVEVDKNALNPYERNLINQDPRLLTIVDWDGVMGSPPHTVLRFIQKPSSWGGGFGEMKKLGRVNLEEWRWFKKMAQASDYLVVWSSRFLVNEESPLSFIAKPFEGAISYWPLFDKSSLRRLSLIEPNKIEVWPQKPLLDRKASLAKIIDGTTTKSWEMIYYVGSSHFDRQTVRRFVKKNPHLAPRFAFFDTSHLIF